MDTWLDIFDAVFSRSDISDTSIDGDSVGSGPYANKSPSSGKNLNSFSVILFTNTYLILSYAVIRSMNILQNFILNSTYKFQSGSTRVFL